MSVRRERGEGLGAGILLGIIGMLLSVVTAIALDSRQRGWAKSKVVPYRDRVQPYPTAMGDGNAL